MSELLTMEQIKALPSEAREFDAAVYFLWLDGELQYIGKTRNMTDRINRHLPFRLHGRLRTQRAPDVDVDFDSYTFLLVANSSWKTAAIDAELTELERLYQAEYPTVANKDLNARGGW
jgi:hypothetical protein